MQETSRILLDLYPSETLRIIISICGVENLVGLFSDTTFLHQNKNLKNCLDHEIKTNGFAYDSSLMDWMTWFDLSPIEELNVLKLYEPSHIQLESPNDFLVLDEYCVMESIEVESKIVVNLQDFSDVFYFEEMCFHLKPSNVVKLSISVEVRWDSTLWLDMGCFCESIRHLSSRILSFRIQPGPASFEGEIELGLFGKAEILDLAGGSIKGSFSSCPNLKSLTYACSPELELGCLPPSLKKLCCYSSYLNDNFDNKDVLPTLDSLYIVAGSRVPLAKFLRNTLSPKTNSLAYMQRNSNISDFVKIIQEVVVEVGIDLESLSLEGELTNPLEVIPSTGLALRGSGNIGLTSWLQLPSTIKMLEFIRQPYAQVDKVLQMAPSGLEYFYLSGLGRTSEVLAADLSRCMNLKHLTLKDCGLTTHDLESIRFPDSVKFLGLPSNKIESLEGISFPPKLQSLDLSLNKLKFFEGISLPCTLKKLNLKENEIERFDLAKNNRYEDLQLEYVQLGSTLSITVSLCKLPESIRFLLLSGFFSNTPVQFGDNLVCLQMASAANFHNMIFSKESRLRSLYIGMENYREFDMQLPDTLERVEMRYMSKIPSQLGKLLNLKCLKLTWGNVKEAIIEFSSNSLEELDLSVNDIKRVQLTFPGGETHLKEIDLSDNKLKRISLARIGQNGTTFHKKLHVIKLSNNKDLKKADVNKLMKELYSVTGCEWTNHDIRDWQRCRKDCLMRNNNLSLRKRVFED